MGGFKTIVGNIKDTEIPLWFVVALFVIVAVLGLIVGNTVL